MFKIESYITPLLMGYLDKYVKLRPEDFQLSLWGGDAVLYNLDLRLDIIEKAIELPIVFQSGHIHELRLHVPWTKLGSDPVIITINTIECVLKVRDTAYRERSETPGKSSQKQRVRKQDQDLPPGYLQSLMNKIVNNANIIINNLIVKFVEDDIVLSLNVKSAEIYSVDKNWDRAFVEILAPDFVLRRAINFIDLTVCLDKRDASGKIENYQDPIAYRFSISCRLFTQFENMHAKYSLETKLNIYCERADLSLTDTQLPMLIRLIELALALYYGTMQFKMETAESEPSEQQVPRESKSESLLGEPPPDGSEESMASQGWASWAWSYVPQILPTEGEGEEEAPVRRSKPPPSVFSFGMFANKLTIKFKLTEYMKEKAHYGPRKIVFRPFLYLESEGLSFEMLMQGLAFFNAQVGITNLSLSSQGVCICGAEGEENTRNHVLLSGGDNLVNKMNSNYLCQSLFDPQSPENLGIPISKILDFDEHKQVFTEQYGMQKFGIFWMDYVYGLDRPVNSHSGDTSSKSSVSSVDDSQVFVKESSLNRFIIGPCHINVSSTTVHRIQKVLDAAYKYEYEPYTKQEEERVDEGRPHPTEGQLASLEEFIPIRTTHLTLLNPVVTLMSAEHPYCDVANRTYRTPTQKPRPGQPAPTLYPLFALQLGSQRFDLQTTSPMYPRRLVQLVSKIAGPPSNLLHHCHSHTQLKLFGLEAGLVKVEVTGVRSPALTVLPPTSGAMYTRRLLLNMYWNNIYLPKYERMYELPQLTMTLSKPAIHVAMAIVSSWKQNTPKPADILANSLLDDMFPSTEIDSRRHSHYPSLELRISGLEMKLCRTDVVTSCSGTLSSVHILLYKNGRGEGRSYIPVFSCPCDTEGLHNSDWLMSPDSSPIREIKNDCLTFTYQLPKAYDKVQAPAIVLLSIGGASCSLEPALEDWFSYTPTSRVVKSREPRVELNMELAKAASPLQTNMSQVSQASSGSKRQTSISLTRSPTTGAQSTVPASGVDNQRASQKKAGGIGEKLAQLLPLIRVLQVQVDMKKICVFLPRHHVDLHDPSLSIVSNYQQLARSRSLPDTVVVSLPRVLMQSAGLKALPYVQDLPITTVEGSLVGDKIPWNVSLQNCAIYSLHQNSSEIDLPLRVLHFLKPATVSSTVGVSYKFMPPTSDDVTALGLCLHTDMRTVTMASSVEQVRLLIKTASASQKTILSGIKFLGEVTKSLKAEESSEKTQNLEEPRQNGGGIAQMLGVASIAEENDLPCTMTSGDIASMDTTFSRDTDLQEYPTDGVKLSLWLQWTLPKCQLKMYLAGKQASKVVALVEDITFSLDVQNVYSKVKLNVGSTSVTHFMKTSPYDAWQSGRHQGILMCCRGNLSHDTHILTSHAWVTDRLHSRSNLSGSAINSSNPASREIGHGFLSLTFTRALRRNLKKRLQKLNIETPPCEPNSLGDTFGKFFYHKYVSELCLTMVPCDFIFNLDPVSSLLQNIYTLESEKSKPKHLKSIPTVSDESTAMPWFTSSNLPLIYADMECIRLFLPGPDRSKVGLTGQQGTLWTTADHDMLLFQIHSLTVTPNADNPLPRYAIDKELYQEAVQLGVTSDSGAALTDRQYQLDFKGLSLSSGCWWDFERHIQVAGACSVRTPASQVPAVEWNSLPIRNEHSEIQLFPVISPCDMRLVVAPAIVNYMPSVYGQYLTNLVCGYGMELNIVSDLDLTVSTNQIQLIQHKVKDILGSMNPNKGKCDTSTDETEYVHDSGVGSEISNLTVTKPHLEKKTADIYSYCDTMTPVDLLLTAGRISCTLYSHKTVEKEIKVNAQTSASSRKKNKPKKQDLEWRIDTDSTDNLQINDASPTVLDPYMLHMYTTDSAAQERIIGQGTVCIRPFLFVYISQPHTVLSLHREQQKFETSSYDVLVKGATEDLLIPVTDARLLPDCSDFSVYWLESRAGRPHPQTGIPPSLYTLGLSDFMTGQANVYLQLERPLRTKLSFPKVKQVMQFMDEVLPRSKVDTGERSSTKPHTEDSERAKGKQLDILRHVSSVVLQTEQIVVSMETKPCDEQPEVSSSFSNLQMQIGFTHGVTGEVTGITMNAYMRDCMLKTTLNNRQLPLLGPCSLKADATFTIISHGNTNFLSQTIVTIATGMVTVNLGQEHVLCLQMVLDHITEFSKVIFKSKDDLSKSKAGSNNKVPPISTGSLQFVVHSSSDDLRSGQYQYRMSDDDTDLVPNLGEIVFCNQDRSGNSTMTWGYSTPRVISSLTSTPVPFNTQNIIEPPITVACRLQYWEGLIQQFVDYAEMSLSENDVSEMVLPEVRHADSRDLAAAQIWRLNIPNPEGSEVLVPPASLAASVKVDSCFVPCLIPGLQLGVTLESLELHLTNHLHCLGRVVPTKLQPFYLCPSFQPAGEFAVVTLDNLLLAASHWAGSLNKSNIQGSTSLGVDILEYKTLTMDRVVSTLEISGTVSLQTHSQTTPVRTVDVDIACDPVTLTFGQGVVHSLTCAAQAWTQIGTADPSQEDSVIFAHYVICNNTQQTLRLGQVGTDENLVLQPREMHQYSWRSHTMKQELHICLDGAIWKWCDAVKLGTPGAAVRKVSCHEQQYTLVINTRQISNVQCQVIISGLLSVSNRLSHHCEVKVVALDNNQEVEHRAVAGSQLTVPSYVLDPDQVLGIKFRPWGSNGAWSNSVSVASAARKDNTLVKLIQDDRFYHVWCRLFTHIVHGVTRVFVVLCPLYMVRSHLPFPLYINIDTSRLGLHDQISTPGRGHDLQLQCPGGDLYQSLTFQFDAHSGKSSTSVTLSTGLIEQLKRAPQGKFDPATLTSFTSDQCWYNWPYIQEDKYEEVMIPDLQNTVIPEITMGNQPTIDLNVSLSEFWAGYQTVLVDIAPSYLVTNGCDLDLVFMGSEDIQYDLSKGQTICPPKLERSFHIGAKLGDAVFMSEPVPVSNEELMTQRYRPDAGHTLYMDHWVHVHLLGHFNGTEQVCFLTVTSSLKNNIRVIHVRERYNLTNLTKFTLALCPFSIPESSKKVQPSASVSNIVPSHIGCHRDKSDLAPVTFHPLAMLFSNDKKADIDSSTKFVNYLSIAHVQSIYSSQTLKHILHFDWSYPVRLSANESGVRMTLSLVVKKSNLNSVQSCHQNDTGEKNFGADATNSSDQGLIKFENVIDQPSGNTNVECVTEEEIVNIEALCVTAQEERGVTYLTVKIDNAPTCFIQNHCNFPLYIGQAMMNLTLKGTTVQEETELVDILPCIPVGGSRYYTPPFLNTTFPQILDNRVIPKLHISGKMPSSMDQSDLSNLKWSDPIDLLVAADNFVSIPGLADVKVHVIKVAMVTNVTISPISKADVSAKEIRSRLKGKERTITVTPQIKFNEESTPKEAALEVSRATDSKKTESSKPKSSLLKISVGVLAKHVSIVMLDEVSSATLKQELICFTLDDLFIATYPASDLLEMPNYHRNCIVMSCGNVQLDNQKYQTENFDFPVVLVRKDFDKPWKGCDVEHLTQLNVLEKQAVLKSSSIMHIQIVYGTVSGRNSVIEKIECSIKPVNCYIDDKFVLHCIKQVGTFLPVPLSIPEPLPMTTLKLPKSVKTVAQSLSSPVQIGHLLIHPVSAMFSVHASMKLFIASDETPLQFGKFEKLDLSTTSYQLTRALAMHYAFGALFRAGAVVGSLEILGNPTGLVRSIGTGVADFFRMPYRGLTKGPGAFVVGVSQGTSSMVKHVTAGMLKSVTNFASSVSRNMDRLSLDGGHIRRQEESRRHRPDGVSEGLKQGLTGLGISVLGAVAGLADHPIQSLLSSGQGDQEGEGYQGSTATATGLVTGMGKGLVGVFTKPIGGAAEFVSQTGQGILHGTGLCRLPTVRHSPVEHCLEESVCGQVKYALKLLQTLPSSDILCCVEAGHVDLTEREVPVTLVLTPEILFVMNHEEDSQQQSFSLLELECGVTLGEQPTLSIIWRDTQVYKEDQVGMSNAERVSAFIDSTTKYMQEPFRPLDVNYMDLSLPLPNHAQSQIIGTSTPELSESTQSPKVFPNLAADQDSKGRQSGSYNGEGRQLSDSQSDSSIENTESNMATLPQYDFKMNATKIAAFLAVFNITKQKLQGSGFRV